MPAIPESLPDTTWDALDALAASGEHWHSLQSSHFARETALLAELADELQWQRDADPLTLMRRLTSALFHTFTYAQSETRVDSPIDDALKARGGVCQDLAHIMIALARRIGIPCRYVSGYLSTSSESHDRSTEGATHAWAEAYLPELGWIGFDPTNDRACSRAPHSRRRRARLCRCAADARRVPRRSGQRARRSRHGVSRGLANSPGPRHANDDVGCAWRRTGGRLRRPATTTAAITGCNRCNRCDGCDGGVRCQEAREGKQRGSPPQTCRATCRVRDRRVQWRRRRCA